MSWEVGRKHKDRVERCAPVPQVALLYSTLQRVTHAAMSVCADGWFDLYALMQ